MAPGAVTRGGRLLPNLVPMFNKNEEKGYFSQSCVVRSAVIVWSKKNTISVENGRFSGRTE